MEAMTKQADPLPRLDIDKEEAIILRNAINHYIEQVPFCLLHGRVTVILNKLERIVGHEF